ncbi:cin-4 [Symbiodinium microadriaticum]|nr:cin-4 [Symbiodinium microadriaticum]
MRHDDQNRKSTSDLQVHVESWIPALVATVPDDPLRLVRKIFLDEDLDLLPPQQEDGQSVEPRSMLPILPLVLINGFQGIGTGWATQGPNFDPLEVVDRLEQIIRGEPVSSLSPSYRNFHGEVIQQNGRFYSLGAWTVLSLGSGSPDTVEITELPVGVWTHDFIETVEAKAKAKNVMLKVHKCQDHDDQHVHLLIGFEPGQLLKGGAVDQATSKIEQLLGLRKRLPSQMWLYQAAPI